jgi:hypothetical protein
MAETAGLHVRQALLGSSKPLAWQTPSIRHPVMAVDKQRSASSSHTSSVQSTPSPQPRGAPEHCPLALQVSSLVQNRPSSQLAPALLSDQAVVERAGSQISQGLSGEVLPGATQAPRIAQPAKPV